MQDDNGKKTRRPPTNTIDGLGEAPVLARAMVRCLSMALTLRIAPGCTA